MKELGKILLVVLAVLLGGALLAPPLYWAAHGIMDAGGLLFLQKYAFQKYFNRSLLIMAVLLFWPMVRWLGVGGWRPVIFGRDARRAGRFWLGFGLGAAAMGGLAAGYVGAGVYAWQGAPEAGMWIKAAASALAVGFLEEALFRGALAGLFERGMGRGAALWGTSVVFAAVHFLKPDPSVTVEAVRWYSGLELVPRMFHQFAEPLLLLAGFGTLLAFGGVLGMAAQRTGTLWLSIGLHAGLVFVKLVFVKASERLLERLPWVGAQLEVGLWPVLTLGALGGLVWVATRRPGEGAGG